MSDSENNITSGNETNSDSDYELELSNISTQITTKGVCAIYHEYLKNNKLFLQPEYQRDFCWSLDKMNAFIDTIMKGWIIPNYVIYELSKKEIKNVKYKCECIDGQHRLTTLKKYIESSPLDENKNKYIYWLNNGFRIFYDMNKTILDKLNKGNHVKFRNLTDDEKYKFDNFQMSFHMISAQNGLDISTKCDIFNRLQNGEKVSSYDKLKNYHKNEITNCIRKELLCKYIDDLNFANKIIFKHNPKKPKQYYIYFLIRTFFIIDKKSLDINYLDINIKKGVTANDGKGEPKYRLKNSIDSLLPKVKEIIKFIAETEYKTDSNMIIKEVGYIFVCIYANYGIDELITTIKWLNTVSNSKQFEKLNDIKSYISSIDKVVPVHKIMDHYQTIIKLILKKNTNDYINAQENMHEHTYNNDRIGIVSKSKI